MLRFFGLAGKFACLLALGLAVAACGSTAPSDRPAVQFAAAPAPPGGEHFPNWPVPPHVIDTELVQALRDMRMEVLDSEKTDAGITGASQVTLYLPGMEKSLKFKWKPARPGSLDQDNNSPRREIASYEIQKLFLDPEDYVVPTSLIFCLPVTWYQGISKDVPAPSPGTDCVVGNLSVWLENVTLAEPIYDEARFLSDPNYAYFMANFNLFTYLVSHLDGKVSNFLRSKDQTRPQVFSIDNGISFRAFPYNFFVENWDVIRVPALRKETIERLRQVKRDDLDHLVVVAQLKRTDDRMLVSAPVTASINPGSGVAITDQVIQFGLTGGEIGDLWGRIQEIIAMVDSGQIPVF